jgi:lysophospholipase L1-like esterase
MPMRMLLPMLALCGLGACATARPQDAPGLAPGSRYVAMGSSFAAGPGVGTTEAGAPARCQRSTDNYAHQLARALDLALTDVSCGGATTAHILGRWNELPPQIDAVTPDTRLVTITIGGNDVSYIGGLVGGSCRFLGDAPLGGPGGAPCFTAPTVSEEQWSRAAASMREIAAEVRRRAPSARLVFVDYLTVLPERGTCPAAPLAAARADASRAVAARLAKLTARVAGESGAGILRASALSRDHGACGALPWMTGFPDPKSKWSFPPYHPNRAGMTAVAAALRALLAR